jgi:hypothetical protein
MMIYLKNIKVSLRWPRAVATTLMIRGSWGCKYKTFPLEFILPKIRDFGLPLRPQHND